MGPSLNFRLGEINALIGLEQMKQLQLFKKKRSNLVNYYISQMSQFKDFFEIINFESKKIFWHLFSILLKDKIIMKKKKFIYYLRKHKIATQIHYKPLSLHKEYKRFTILNDSNNSIKFYKSQLTLPLHVNMKKKDIDFIVKKISGFLNNH